MTWYALPNEMKHAVVDYLTIDDARSLSRVDLLTYNICIKATFNTVTLNTLDRLLAFLENVPRSYCNHIQHLTLSTESCHDFLIRARTEAVISLLIASPRLTNLTLLMAGPLDKSVITPFAYLSELKQLSITNTCEESLFPLSERLVVSIAATIPNLEQLSLDKITRSKIHAPELDGVYPYVPLVLGDDDIPDHPSLGSNLSLPSLLRIPTLQKLTIRDTHLGDPQWASTPVACRLQVLDLGSCYHETEDFNRTCTERIMAAVGPSIDEFSLTTSVSDSVFAKPSVTPLQRLRKLHISPFFPVDSVVDTMANLAGSPIESLSMQCYEEDVVDVCSALSDFLSVRVERGPEFYSKLSRIDVSVTTTTGDDDDEGGSFSSSLSSSGDKEEIEERATATQRLQEFCRDLRLKSVVGKADPASSPFGGGRSRASSVCFPGDDKYCVDVLA